METFSTSILRKLFPLLLPLAARWVEATEKTILETGRPLSDEGLEDVRLLGVKHPEKIRFLKVDQIPLPTNPILRWAAQATGLMGPHTYGMAFRYGIMIRQDWWECGDLQRHECVHTGQYERMGVKSFLGEYLRQCLEIGYPEAPLEQEAIVKSGWPPSE